MDDSDDHGLCEYLSQCGLTHIKWLKRFKDENITNIDQIRELENREDMYLALSLEATPVQAAVLKEIFEIKAPNDSAAVGLERELHRVGLNFSYWSKVFAKQLSIVSPEALQHVGEESYQLLAQFVNKPWEKRALRKLLKMKEGDQISFETQREKQKEKLKNRQAECAKLLQDLKNLQKEGKGRHHTQEIEQGLRERLQIPTDVWVQDDANLSQVITQMETVHGGILKSREDVSDYTVIEKASSGLALRGVFITKDSNDATELKQNMLRMPDDISLDGPSHSQHESLQRFSCKTKEDKFLKRLENLGYSAAAVAKAGFWGVSFEASAGYSRSEEEEETKELHHEEMYSSTVKYSIVPMASFSFKDHQLHLSENALSHLQKINHVLLTDATKSIQIECEGFFRKFGSHACIGPLHFGGVYRWKSFSSGFTESELHMVQELQSEAITVQVGVSYGGIAGVSISGSVTNMKDMFRREYSQNLTSKTVVEVTITGGPPEVTSLPDWKNGLVASNTNWSLIDRGTEGMPIWDIVEMNYSDSFSNCPIFVKRLKQAWQKLNEGAKPQPNISTSQFEDMMDGISHWNKNPDPTQYKTQLSSLMAHKERVAKQFMNPQVWPTQILSQQPLQQFLQSVVDFCQKGSSEDSSSLKRHLRQLLDPIDLDAVRVFPNQQYIIEWLYNTKKSVPAVECQDFLSLNGTFKLALDYMQSAMLPHGRKRIETVPPPDCSIRATKMVAKAVLNLRCYLQKSGQNYEDLFLTTMLYPFKYHRTKHHFEVLLGLSDLKCLCEKFETEAETFFIIQKRSVLSLQAYLFSLTITMYDELDVNEAHVIKYAKYLESEIGDEMKTELAQVLTDLRLNDPEYDWEWFKSELDPLVEGTPIFFEGGDALLDVLAKGGNVDGNPYTIENPHIPHKNYEETKQLFSQLELNNYFPKKLSLSHALAIREDTLEVSKEHQTSEADKNTMDSTHNIMQSLCCNNPQIYPFLILQKIMAFDHRCRIKLLPHNRIKNESSSEESDSDDDDNTEGMIHPMDGLLALLHCADNILRQDLMNRLAICQLAIPLLLPDPITHEPTFLLWGMRSIIKEFRNYDASASYSGPIVHYEAPITSFLRFGNHSISKSKVLNAVLSASKHDTFFHYDCAGGRAKKLLLNGVVEVGWYLPSKNDNRFPDAVTFLNLRGNASEHPKQIRFLSEVCCMHFVLLKEDDMTEGTLSVLKQLSNASGGIVVIQTQSSSKLKPWLKQSISAEKFSIIKQHSKNEDETKVSIQKKIKDKFGATLHTLEHCRDIAWECGIQIDEDELSCKQGREMAKMVLTHIEEFKKSHPSESPKQLLVLQSKAFWHKYGEREKEQYRQTGKGHRSMYDYAELQVEKMKHIRRCQFDQCQKLSPLMTSFLTSLLTSQGEVVWYYLQWLKLYLDDLSRELLPPIHREYQKKRKELNDIQMQEKKDEIAEKVCRCDINEMNMQLINASFGPEHMFREIGQIYEAVMSQSDASADLRSQVCQLPEIAAQLLVDGFPLELMDGDAAHVPIKWVSSVLDKLSTIINQGKVGISNPQVFVLSVLGLQSTGKSTLMNTLFGVQFSVSAGRCTRGAFMQLLPVHISLQRKCKYQYFLIVDTEGLRAPELDALKMQKHDNELATFVIGIANLTIINIKGEISGDMDNVLQTAVHAFLRMNKVELTPSCHFVYQNVPAVTAGDNKMQGRFKIKDKLDAMTNEAAEQERISQIHYFNQVITFDYEKDVTFFPDLWTGSPPMGHVSEFYSVEAQTLKHCLIKCTKRSRYNPVQYLKQHLEALWNAILQENFVFSFKNTFEIAAYTKLEEEYGEWSWEFKKAMEEWEQVAHNELQSCLLGNLRSEYQKKKTELPKHVNTVYMDLKTKMDTYFDESPEQETVVKWRVDIEYNLNELKKKLEGHANNACDNLFMSRNSRAKADLKIKSLRLEILEHVQCVASGLERGSLSEEELERKFQECWIGWVTDLMPHIDRIIPPNIETEVENSVREYLTPKRHHKLLHQKLTQYDAGTRTCKQWGLHLHLVVKACHLHIRHSLWKQGVNTLMSVFRREDNEFLHHAQERTGIVFTEVKRWLNNKRNSGEDFKSTYTTEVLDVLSTNIKEGENTQYYFTPEYDVEMALTACGYAQGVFEEMSKAFCKAHDPLEYIEAELRPQCWKLFKDNYEEIAKEKTAAEALCTQLKNPIRMQVLLQLEGVVTKQMRAKYRWLKSKKRLRAKILHEIGERLEEERKLSKYHGDINFSECTLYLFNPKQSLENWIKLYTMKYCDEGGPTRIAEIALKILPSVVKVVKASAMEVTESLSTTSQATTTQGGCYINDWLSEFHGRLKTTLVLDLSKLCAFGEDATLTSIVFFKNEVIKGLDKLQTVINDEFRAINGSVWNEHKLAKMPHDTLFEDIAGCTEQCPFCREQCEYTEATHPESILHSVTHRPQCLGGCCNNDNTMVLDVCTFLVASNDRFQNKDTEGVSCPYNEYSKYYPKWDIPQERSLEASAFWIWLVGNFSKNIEACFGRKETEIHSHWKGKKWAEVKQMLENEYQGK